MPLRRATAEFVTNGLNLNRKVILVTGITSGIGKETARVLAMREATVIGTGRTLASVKDACLDIGERALPFECELSDPRSVRKCVEEIRKQGLKIDAIIANAGIMAPKKCELIHGVEQQFYINHISHFILIQGLLDLLTDTGRIVIVSSDLHKNCPRGGIDYEKLNCKDKYDPLESYAISKFANVAYARYLSRQFEGTQKRSIALHPGVIYTNLLRYQNVFVRSVASMFGKYLFKSIEQGASTQCYAAVHPHANAPVTGYMENCKETTAHPDANSKRIQERLIEESERIAERG